MQNVKLVEMMLQSTTLKIGLCQVDQPTQPISTLFYPYLNVTVANDACWECRVNLPIEAPIKPQLHLGVQKDTAVLSEGAVNKQNGPDIQTGAALKL